MNPLWPTNIRRGNDHFCLSWLNRLRVTSAAANK
jgi:hypothetical protein